MQVIIHAFYRIVYNSMFLLCIISAIISVRSRLANLASIVLTNVCFFRSLDAFVWSFILKHIDLKGYLFVVCITPVHLIKIRISVGVM